MGNIFCGDKEENQKAAAFQLSSEQPVDGQAALLLKGTISADSTIPSSNNLLNDNNLTSKSFQNQAAAASAATTLPTDPLEALRQQAVRDEEARLQLILQTAGRGMVAVRSTRGSTAYYDQGFAAALGQHLEQTTQFPPNLPTQLPSSSKQTSTVYSRLSKPVWQDIWLGDKDGLAGCAGENPHTYLDQKAEAFLDQVRPKKENLFVGVRPMVENLL